MFKRRGFSKFFILVLCMLLAFQLVGVGCSGEVADEEEKDLNPAEEAKEAEKESDEDGDYPNRPLRLIVSYSAGAATDTQARIFAEFVEEELGQPLVVENIEGAGGQVGWNEFSQVEPDGYTLAAFNLPHILAQPLVMETQYTKETFEPIFNWGWDPTVFAVREDSPYETVDDLIEDAKERPGEISIGKAGLYIGHHFLILQVKDETGVEFNQMPYDGASDAAAALLGGHIDVVSGNLSDMHRLKEDGEIRILAIATEERHEFEPDVPTFKELGYEDAIMSTDRGIAAPKGTPDHKIEKLEEAFYETAQNPDYKEQMEEAGADLMFLERDEVFDEFEEREEILENLLQEFGHLD
ncbi:tripartite tricarboxylate transporter substrate binding protein [Natranaerofaba carboxydovora]|uniref:tripartite tricarboxylate transporter substrate binding protein n=1 Tax=Natranaerofaba carboxydovora TaxID=2742683 RepID=UPI001F137932|nr:tripartite tricarboxylate transporter substrate binding protein [Natranaerofaba carboxydovora]UMZ72820.1 Tripartite tricarboxylate transporter family receptor [Natranaerofaba carboxydovora]